MLLAALPLGVAIGLAVGTLGGGGSVLAVPVLVYLLGQSVHEATTASLLIVTAGALAGSIGHQRGGHVCWRHATIFSAAAIPGVIAGTAAGNAVGGAALIGAFGGVMLLAAAGMWRRASGAADGHGGEPAALCPPLRAGRDVAAGVAIGFATGFFGVGGGFLVVPTLAIALAFSMRLAVSTSLAIITITSAFGLAAHLASGRGVDAPLTITMAAACAGGAYLGSAIASRVPQRELGRAFALLVTAVAAYLVASAAFFGGPPGS